MSVMLEFVVGQISTLRKSAKAQKDFDHDWLLYIKGAKEMDIDYFINKIVFHLHKSCKNPTRTLYKSPYFVNGVGYAGEEVQIDVHFRHHLQPVRYNYTIELPMVGKLLNQNERHKYIFRTPSADLRRKLLVAGGVAVSSKNELKSHRDMQGRKSQHSNPISNPQKEHQGINSKSSNPPADKKTLKRKSCSSVSPSQPPRKMAKTMDAFTLELMELQSKISESDDCAILRQVVKIVAKSYEYEWIGEYFEADLRRVNPEGLQELHNLLGTSKAKRS